MAAQPEETGLIVAQSSALVLPSVSADGMRAAMRAYTELKAAVLTDADYQPIKLRGEVKKFVKRSGWRKLAVAFSVSSDKIAEEIDYDDAGNIVRARVTYRATAPNGRHEDGTGACSLYERCCPPKNCPQARWDNHRCCPGKAGGCDGLHAFSKPDHDIVATAETRAKNRACADLFAYGELSAEEMQGVDRSEADQGSQHSRVNVRLTNDRLGGPVAPAAAPVPPAPRAKVTNPIVIKPQKPDAAPSPAPAAPAPEVIEGEVAEEAVAVEVPSAPPSPVTLAVAYAEELARMSLMVGGRPKRVIEAAQSALDKRAQESFGRHFGRLTTDEVETLVERLASAIKAKGGKLPEVK